MKTLITATLVATLSLTSMSASAQSAEQRGFEIAQQNSKSNEGFGSTQVDLTMILRNKAGNEVARELTIQTLDHKAPGEGDKSLTTFNSPKDVEGTSMLTHIKIEDSDDQWLYLPKLKRVKRISSSNKSGPFMGSEFAFEDFASFELDKFTYKYIGDDTVDGLAVYVVERYPTYEKSGYVRQVTYIDTKDFQTRKVDYYDRKDALLKTLSLKDYRLYGEFWRAHTLEMVNHQTGKSTVMSYGEYDFEPGLTEGDFEKGKLSNAR